ncbi:hypothetical protein A4R43_08715 [Amycolatopsis albispora]|uniref:Uncharacterized protein n=1 Tax=Amycolatopsis albispora TaxID=1804986 RepID=A0A344L3H6_9PSEU|nr:hypothetical protein A4R43_08715 [Amycolatopsis albispora]
MELLMPVDIPREPVDNHVQEDAGVFESWIAYLLSPDKHDGPRLYVCQVKGCGARLEYDYNEGWVGHDCPGWGGWHFRDSDNAFELRSVLDGIDPGKFFYALYAFSNVWASPPGQIGETFSKLVDPFLLDSAAKEKMEGEDYPESSEESANNVRAAFATLQSGIRDARTFELLAYHQRALGYAIGHENQMLAIAESLGRYRAIHLTALNEVRDLMVRMTERFHRKLHPPEDGGPEVSFVSAAIAAIVGTVTTVATGPAGGAAAIAGILAALGSVATDLGKDAEKRPVPDGTWRELADDFLREANRIGDEAYEALTSLPKRLTSQIETIRTKDVLIAGGQGGKEGERMEQPRLQPPAPPVF